MGSRTSLKRNATSPHSSGKSRPIDVKTEAAALGEMLTKSLPPSRLDPLEQIAAKATKAGDVDARGWLTSMAYSATRAGVVICDSLDAAAQILTREGDGGSPVPAKDRVKEGLHARAQGAELRARA
ncbi:MAG: hypothetical protein K1X88_35265 [Nannocystaceae bacterium]|nr:hypothetical protein [Nannocystaceae bacterium]